MLTGFGNAAAEGVNRPVKLVYRSGFGFTNVTNQQRRSRYAASRSTRPLWLSAQRPGKAGRHDGPPLTVDDHRSRHLNILWQDKERESHTVTDERRPPVAA